MANYYNQHYVSMFYYKKYDRMINDPNFHYDVTNLAEREKFVYLEHYLVYRVVNGYKLTENEERLAAETFKNIRYYPNLFVNSPMLNEHVVELITPSKEYAARANNFIKNYYKRDALKELYDKYMNSSLTPEENDRFFAILNSSLFDSKRLDDNKNKIMYQEVSKKLLEKYTYIRDMTVNELQFYGQYVTHNFTNSSKEPAVVNIFDSKPNLGGYQKRNEIWMNKSTEFGTTLTEYTQCVCHENRHAAQEQESMNDVTRVGFDLAVFEIFSLYLSTAEFDSYHKNYNHQDIELDAEKSGFFNGGVMLRSLGRGDLADKLSEIRKNRLDKRDYYAFMVNADGKPCSKSHYVVANLDRIVAEHPELVTKYPALEPFYTKEGKRRSLGNLVDQSINATFETRGLYDYFMDEIIKEGQLDKLDLKAAGRDKSTQLFEKLASMTRDHLYNFVEYCREPYKENQVNDFQKGRIVTTTLYEIRQYEYILDFLINNSKFLMATRGEKLSNSSYIYKFIYDLRDFNLDNIQNEVLKNNPNFRTRVNSIMKKYNTLVTTFNRVHVADRLKDVSPEIMGTMIEMPDGRNIQFVDFFRDIHEKMDTHQYIEFYGQKVYISDLIAYYKKAAMAKQNNIVQANIEQEETHSMKIA